MMMALLRLDFLAVYLSDHVVAGFTMGAAAQAVVSQLAKVFGIEAMPKREGFFKMFRVSLFCLRITCRLWVTLFD